MMASSIEMICCFTQEILELRASLAAECNRRMEAEAARDQEYCCRLQAEASAAAANSAASAAREAVLAVEHRLRFASHQALKSPPFMLH